MAKLSEDEQGLLDKLTKKLEAPEEAVSKAINFTVDLGDKAQVAMAKAAGWLPDLGGDGDKGGKGGEGSSEGDPDPDSAPRRRSYFPPKD
jgi:hypothetical protein